MTLSDNSFLIRSRSATQITRTSPTDWQVEVGENGDFSADFLVVNTNLNIMVSLSANGAKCDLNAVYLCNDNNKIDMNIHVLHRSGNTTSSQKIRGLAADKGQVSVLGTITIPYDSQKCDGHQNHRGILLSDSAKISATPMLEIWADDVRCAHGSAIGPLDKNQIFYLQTRGIPENEAKKILLLSFFNGILGTKFDKVIQDWVKKYV